MSKRETRQYATYQLDQLPSKMRDDVDKKQINRCPSCQHPWSKGEVGAGSMLEIKCSKCYSYFYFRAL